MAQPITRVLVVDDEASIRSLVDRVLRDGGYDVTVASSGPDALHLVNEQAPFDLFVIDLMMPEMRGDEFARQLRTMHPDSKVLYFTGHSDQLFERRQMLWEHEAYLDKPVTTKGLLEAVSLLLHGEIRAPKSSG